MINKKIFLVGPMGAGKSTVGQILSKRLQLQFLDSDQIFASKFNSTIMNIFNIYGEDYFREQEGLLLEELTQITNSILATGGGCILRKDTRITLASGGLVCYLRVSPAQQQRRCLATAHRPTLPSGDSRQLEFFQKMHFERSALYESIAHVSIDTDFIGADAAANIIVNKLKEYNESNQ